MFDDLARIWPDFGPYCDQIETRLRKAMVVSRPQPQTQDAMMAFLNVDNFVSS